MENFCDNLEEFNPKLKQMTERKAFEVSFRNIFFLFQQAAS